MRENGNDDAGSHIHTRTYVHYTYAGLNITASGIATTRQFNTQMAWEGENIVS